MSIKLWEPSQQNIEQANLTAFIQYVNKTYNQTCKTYKDIHAWSIQYVAEFWQACASFCNIEFNTPPSEIVDNATEMPGTVWFKGATLNYAQHCLQRRDDTVALYEVNEAGLQQTLSWNALYNQVSCWQQFFREKGIQKGDSVAGVLPNNVTAITAMLGATSLGAVWSSCSPDFGEQGICDRLEQIQLKCVVSVAQYLYKGKTILLEERLQAIKDRLKNTSVWVNASEGVLNGWDDLSSVTQYAPTEVEFVPCGFQDPLFILFSSGTTGKPKCIVHSVGGTLVQHLKEHRLHCDIKPTDIFFYYTTCGWMMWNWMVSALASSIPIVVFDGAAITATQSIWDLIKDYNITIFGCSASFVGASQKRNINIKDALSNNTVRLILSTGSPLLPNHYDYLYNAFNTPIQVGSISGGTDIVSCFALSNPLTPVIQGRLQGVGLGMDVVSYSEDRQVLIGEKGDLVCRNAAPCMPIYFLNDTDNKRYKDAYFNGGQSQEWYHGDYIMVYDDGSVEILGRSDATLNPGGIRIGTAEFYEILDTFESIEDSIVSSAIFDTDEKIILFVKLVHGGTLTPELKKSIRLTLKEKASPRHMPQMIVPVSAIPYTKNGKKCEVAVKKLLRGDASGVQPATLLQPDALTDYEAFSEQLLTTG